MDHRRRIARVRRRFRRVRPPVLMYKLRLEERESPRRHWWLRPRRYKVWNCYRDGKSLDWDYPEWAKPWAEAHWQQCALFELTCKSYGYGDD